MSERGLGRELEDLRRRIGPALCASPAPCAIVTSSEVRLLMDGHEVRSGAEPRPLCEGCPNRETRAVRHVEVRLDCRDRHGGEGTRERREERPRRPLRRYGGAW